GVDQLPVAGHLVAGDAALAVGAQLVDGGAGARLEDDPGHDLLAVGGAGHADDLGIADRGMGVQVLLDLARIDVLAAADDHVLDTADDVDVALGVHGREVAGVHPAGVVDGATG